MGVMSFAATEVDVAVLVGLQASGKSTFYAQRLFGRYALVSKDLFPRGAKNKQRRQMSLVEDHLTAGRSVAVDNTNPSPQEWGPLVEAAHARGATVTAYWFPPDVAGSLRRNAAREGRARVPDIGVLATLKRLREPSPADGFDAVREVSPRTYGFGGGGASRGRDQCGGRRDGDVGAGVDDQADPAGLGVGLVEEASHGGAVGRHGHHQAETVAQAMRPQDHADRHLGRRRLVEDDDDGCRQESLDEIADLGDQCGPTADAGVVVHRDDEHVLFEYVRHRHGHPSPLLSNGSHPDYPVPAA
ncbi:AAA family ATPase [Streptomyces bobili]|uniref:AAA family ATPase n=1 Tax=Streptomyces bobili TaxID=67280 RepID=UPI0037B99C5E